MGPATPDGTAARVVIDTNVLLEWLVFRDTRVVDLVRAIEGGAVHWVATAAMRNELAAVLARGFGPRWPVGVGQGLPNFDRLAVLREARVAGLATPRCRDPDDQMFVDLAVTERAASLISRDRAVLALRRRLASFGVAVDSPEHWRHG